MRVAVLYKWKKLFIGVGLLIGFIIFTQYKQNAEPVWKVNEKTFRLLTIGTNYWRKKK